MKRGCACPNSNRFSMIKNYWRFQRKSSHNCQKARILELLFEYVKEEKLVCYEQLDCETIVFLKKDKETRVKLKCDEECCWI